MDWLIESISASFLRANLNKLILNDKIWKSLESESLTKFCVIAYEKVVGLVALSAPDKL